MVFLNGAVQDWWGGAGFGGRRFDATLPLLVLGTALALERSAAWVDAPPAGGGGACRTGFRDLEPHIDGGGHRRRAATGSPQCVRRHRRPTGATLHRWLGHPFSYPANLIFALRNGVTPGRGRPALAERGFWPIRFVRTDASIWVETTNSPCSRDGIVPSGTAARRIGGRPARPRCGSRSTTPPRSGCRSRGRRSCLRTRHRRRSP